MAECVDGFVTVPPSVYCPGGSLSTCQMTCPSENQACLEECTSICGLDKFACHEMVRVKTWRRGAMGLCEGVGFKSLCTHSSPPPPPPHTHTHTQDLLSIVGSYDLGVGRDGNGLLHETSDIWFVIHHSVPMQLAKPCICCGTSLISMLHCTGVMSTPRLARNGLLWERNQGPPLSI
jgi:hypothetical protein